MKINSTKLKIHPDISQDVCLEDKDMIEVYKMLEILKTYEFGLYVPSYVSNKTVRLLSPGQSYPYLLGSLTNIRMVLWN